MKNSLCESAFFDIFQKMVLCSNFTANYTLGQDSFFFLSKKWILGAKIHILHFLKTWLCFVFSVKIQISNTDKFSSKSNFRTKYWLLPQCVTTICVPKSLFRSTSFFGLICMHARGILWLLLDVIWLYNEHSYNSAIGTEKKGPTIIHSFA